MATVIGVSLKSSSGPISFDTSLVMMVVTPSARSSTTSAFKNDVARSFSTMVCSRPMMLSSTNRDTFLARTLSRICATMVSASHSSGG